LLATGTIWTLLVWGIIGGAITRVAVVRLGCDEAVPIRSALGYSSSRLSAYMLSPLFPILFVLLLAIPLALLGILMRFEMGVLLVSLVWILVLVAGLGMAYQLLGTMFGWPLMWVVISAEETGDHYEAYSRSFAYTFQRPFHYLFYATVALVLGGLGWLLIQVFAELAIYMSYWSVMWGCGLENVKELREVGGAIGGEESWMLTTGRLLMKASEGLVGVVASAYAYSYFWCASAGIYLLLRKSVDQTEFDEVFVDDAQSSFDLPPLRDDDSVVPVIADENAADDSAAAGSGDTEEVNTAAQADAEEKPAATDEDLEADDPEEEVIF
ncbi:MAG: hypothetical protein OSB47_13690, partial [Pirellulaceae bacterium]|nr:hypothetical protein [Pirellulaceae bacterium]